MRRSNIESLGSILQQALKELNIERKIKEVRLVKSWETVVGKTINRYTRDLYVKDKTLHVHLHSSVVRQELVMLKQDIVRRLNEQAGEALITDIVFK
jgi:predicted nucleic acid-binding Zn ribbon protein